MAEPIPGTELPTYFPGQPAPTPAELQAHMEAMAAAHNMLLAPVVQSVSDNLDAMAAANAKLLRPAKQQLGSTLVSLQKVSTPLVDTALNALSPQIATMRNNSAIFTAQSPAAAATLSGLMVLSSACELPPPGAILPAGYKYQCYVNPADGSQVYHIVSSANPPPTLPVNYVDPNPGSLPVLTTGLAVMPPPPPPGCGALPTGPSSGGSQYGPSRYDIIGWCNPDGTYGIMPWNMDSADTLPTTIVILIADVAKYMPLGQPVFDYVAHRWPGSIAGQEYMQPPFLPGQSVAWQSPTAIVGYRYKVWPEPSCPAPYGCDVSGIGTKAPPPPPPIDVQPPPPPTVVPLPPPPPPPGTCPPPVINLSCPPAPPCPVCPACGQPQTTVNVPVTVNIPGEPPEPAPVRVNKAVMHSDGSWDIEFNPDDLTGFNDVVGPVAGDLVTDWTGEETTGDPEELTTLPAAVVAPAPGWETAFNDTLDPLLGGLAPDASQIYNEPIDAVLRG